MECPHHDPLIRTLLQRRDFLKLVGLAAASLGIGGIEASARSAGGKRRVIIAGAGIAGLAASQQLRAAGFSTVVVEARRRIGGRIRTDRHGFDHGASWIHGRRGNPLVTLASDARAPTFAFDYDNLWRYSAGGMLADAADRQIDADFRRLENAIARARRVAGSGKALSSIIGRETDRLDANRCVGLRYAVNSGIILEYGEDPCGLSLRHFDAGAELRGGDFLVPQGYSRLLGPLGKPDELLLGHVVRKITTTDAGVRIETSRGVVTGDAALVTLPLGVLKSGRVRFFPELPTGHRRAIERLGFGTLNKLFLRFPRIAWPAKPHLFGHVGDGWWEEWVNYAPVNGQPVLLGFNGGALAVQSEKMSDRELARSAMRVLRSMFGRSLPDPVQVVATRWNGDPFAGGSYSCYAPGSSPRDRAALARPVSPRLILAGEACSRDHPSTAHGALASGREAAKALIRSLG